MQKCKNGKRCAGKTEGGLPVREHKGQSKGLLEEIAAGAECFYLSDLHVSAYASAIRRAVRKIDPETYSLWEWDDAVQYILGSTVVCKSKEQAKSLLSGKSVREQKADTRERLTARTEK